ncbi:MAG: DUF5615 family PIN-like protein [Acidobacteriota bacterium]
MKALDFPLLTDENIQAEIVQDLLESGKQVRTVWDEALDSRDDAEILQHAHVRGWVVLTQNRSSAAL